FAAPGPKGFENVYVAPTAYAREAPPRQVTFLANAGSNALSWSPTGGFILLGTGQRTEDYQLARVDLVPRTPRFREDQFRDLFREQRTIPFVRPRSGEDALALADGETPAPVRSATTPTTKTSTTTAPTTVPAVASTNPTTTATTR